RVFGPKRNGEEHEQCEQDRECHVVSLMLGRDAGRNAGARAGGSMLTHRGRPIKPLLARKGKIGVALAPGTSDTSPKRQQGNVAPQTSRIHWKRLTPAG